ncbi:hypothetical protein L0128_18440 [candidate division KSB1 bacterium]|nr:hypothetical protein [candidate division KSB1 bacterium]
MPTYIKRRWHELRYLVGMLHVFAGVMAGDAAPVDPQVRGWWISHFEPKYLAEVVRRAPEFGINAFFLGPPASNLEAPFLNQLLSQSPFQREMAAMLKNSRSKKIEVFLETVAVIHSNADSLPAAKINFDDFKLWADVKSQYDSLFRVLPQLAGVVLTCDATITDQEQSISNLPKPERYASLMNTVYQVCRQHQKMLYVRVASWRFSDLQAFYQALEWVPDEVRVITRNVIFDFIPGYPHHPFLGKAGNHPQLVEFDLCGLYLGQANLPWCGVDYLQPDCARIQPDSGFVGACGHIDWSKNIALGSLNEVNLFAFSQFLKNPQKSATDVWNEWVLQRFGYRAVPGLTTSLRRTEKIAASIFFLRGFYALSIRSDLPALPQALEIGHIEFDVMVTSRWNPRFRTIGEKLLAPDSAQIDTILQEKYQALEWSRRGLAELDTAFQHQELSKSNFEYVRPYLKRQLTAAKIWSAFTASIFSLKQFQNQPGAGALRKARFSLTRLRALVAELRQEAGPDFRLNAAGDLNPNTLPEPTTIEKLERLIQAIETELANP